MGIHVEQHKHIFVAMDGKVGIISELPTISS